MSVLHENTFSNQTILEIRAPLWLKIMSFFLHPFSLISSMILLIKGLLLARALDTVYLVFWWIFISLFVWWMFRKSNERWREANFLIRADEHSVIMCYDSVKTHVYWSQVRSGSFMAQNSKGQAGQWLILEDSFKLPLLEWNLNWCRYDDLSLQKTEELVRFIDLKLDVRNKG